MSLFLFKLLELSPVDEGLPLDVDLEAVGLAAEFFKLKAGAVSSGNETSNAVGRRGAIYIPVKGSRHSYIGLYEHILNIPRFEFEHAKFGVRSLHQVTTTRLASCDMNQTIRVLRVSLSVLEYKNTT